MFTYIYFMWMSVDIHLLCPSKDLNPKFLLIMVTLNKMCSFDGHVSLTWSECISFYFYYID